MQNSNNKPKKLVIDYVNRVKIEKTEEFETSLFESVYHSACRMTKKIILENEELEKNNFDLKNFADEQCGNIITFFGRRGMGKSSAMLSFAIFLEKYETGKTGDFSVDTQDTSPVFSVLPRIDATMMVRGENIMDIILAKMWDAFESKSESTHKQEIFLEEMKGDFRKVKKSYEIYKKTLSEKEVIQNMTSIRELHELAACLNLRDDFKTLVEHYLGFILANKLCSKKDRFLVICIDDLDMVMKETCRILEQIRLFLSIPNVIVLATADLDQLTMIYNKQFTEDLMSKDNYEDYEKRQVREYAANYLAKLFPGNMRIFMPLIGTITSWEYEIDVNNETFDEKKLILVLMAEFSGIFYEPYSRKRFFLQKDSLRKIINNLYSLIEILGQKKEERFDLICDWYFAELSEYCKGIEDVEIRPQLQELFEVYDGNYIHTELNMVIQRVLLFVANKYNMMVNIGYDYGDILLLLDMVSNHQKIYNFISLIFGIQIARIKNKNYGIVYYGNRIFNSLLSWQNNDQNTMQNGYDRNSLEKARPLGEMLDMRLIYTEDMDGEEKILKIIKKNLKNIVETFKISLLGSVNIYQSSRYCMWEFSQTGEGGITKELDYMKADLYDSGLDEVEILCSYPYKAWKTTISMDNLFLTMEQYKKYVEEFVLNLYKGLSGYFKIEEPKKQIAQNVKQIIDDSAWHFIEYDKWKTKYKVQSVTDLLPLESVDLMHYITKTLNNMPIDGWQLSIEGCTIDILQRRLNYMLEILKNTENYYACGLLKENKYSEKISQYLEITQIFDLSYENKKKLDMPNYNSSPTIPF